MDVVSSLRKNGYRVTPQRKALLKVISGFRGCFTPLTVYGRAHKSYPSIGLVTVYRMLDTLDRLGLICRIHSSDECRSYMMKKPLGHHHHLICTSCGRVVDVTSCDVSQLQDKIERNTGFTISGHVLEFEGLCQSCSKVGFSG